MTLEALFAHLPEDERAAALNLLRVQLARRRRRGRPSLRDRDEKRCPRCGMTKQVEEFGISTTRPDGRQGYCRECR